MISICDFPTNPSRHRAMAGNRVRGSGGAVSAAAVVMVTLLGLGCGGVNGDDSADLDVQKTIRSALGSTEALQTITTLAQLRAMTLTGNYRLGNNIDASPTGQSGQQFVPIGSPFNPFRGTFDGNGKTINNLKINTNGGWYTGLFAGATGASSRTSGSRT